MAVGPGRHTLRLPIRPLVLYWQPAPNSNGGTGFATANSVITSVMIAPAIFVESLEKYFPPAYSGWRALLQPVARPTERALAGISFSVQPAEAVAIVGPNGAGKSTLLRVLATLIIPTRGRAWIAGCDVERDASRARCRSDITPAMKDFTLA